jgi:pimeloyl-ACP methyl ester carboxylesterase
MDTVNVPETGYARSGDVAIAYQVFGEGPIDLVFAPGYVSNIELGWSLSGRAQFLEALGSFARVIQFDKRGTGMSDPVRGHASLETRMEDVRAVMDAARSERAALFGVDTGGMMSIVFAATYPARTAALVLTGTAARTLWAADHPWGATEAEYLRSVEEEERQWGSEQHGLRAMRRYSPSLPETYASRWAAYLRQSASPGAYAAYQRMNMENDVRGVLSAIHTPTLVAHRAGDMVVDVGAGRHLAERIPGARFLELPGDDHSPFTGSTQELISSTQEFLEGAAQQAEWTEPDRVLATVLFTDIVGSTAKAAELGDARWRELLQEHNSMVRRQLARYRGEEVDTAGDGFFASFDGPARAIRCAAAIQEDVGRLGLELRAGLHTGECELIDGKVGGIAVHIGARIAALAGPDEVVVSSTVKDLVAGSGLDFDEQGTVVLKGIPGDWRLYAVRRD